MGLFACVLIIGAVSFATAGIPDLQTTTANTIYHEGGGTETLSLFSLPNAAGKAFSETFADDGVVENGTIELTLRDGFGAIIVNFPFEDMWVASSDGGMVPCGGTATADRSTDVDGETEWDNPLFAGGNSETLCIVYINGDALTSNGGLAIHFNSADISGDGSVNLTDAGFFTGFLGGSAYEGDFNNDGDVNITDAGFMAAALGASCP
jgi:hypothetical protein